MNNIPETVRVELAERSYDIRIGTGNLPQVGPFLTSLGDVSHVVVITDTNVQSPHAERVAESLAGEDLSVDLMAIEPGEPSKSIDLAAGLWEGLLELGTDRRGVIAAVGGGVVGDLAGFIAATYARGIRFLQVPTSLLAQVDSSVGGKVGINLPEAKNMVGAFLQPVGVLIDTATLETLPRREYLAGLGEVVKYGVALDAALFDRLEANVPRLLAQDHELLVEIVAWCCRLKANVIPRDEREESGLRAVLNYGHTFGHAFETLAGYGNILHGEAVALGMVAAGRLARRLGRVDDRFVERQHNLLTQLGLPTEPPAIDRGKMLDTMTHDKKAAHGQVRFVLPTRLGQVELVDDVPEADVLAALEG